MAIWPCIEPINCSLLMAVTGVMRASGRPSLVTINPGALPPEAEALRDPRLRAVCADHVRLDEGGASAHLEHAGRYLDTARSHHAQKADLEFHWKLTLSSDVLKFDR